MQTAEKAQRRARRLLLRTAILGYLESVAPCRRWARPGQLKAMAKQMEQSNRIPLPVAAALAREIENHAVRITGAGSVGKLGGGKEGAGGRERVEPGYGLQPSAGAETGGRDAALDEQSASG
jgi:hypothetical protein